MMFAFTVYQLIYSKSKHHEGRPFMKAVEVQTGRDPGVIAGKERRTRFFAKLLQQKYLYLMILPGLVYFLLFKYVPMWGIIIAFQDYQPFLGITGSEWVGFKHFERLFTEPTFFMLLKNTLILFFLNLVVFFPSDTTITHDIKCGI